jgi:predicted nucleotide-binding protein (sugar kinase/HSP70/actin superfamily)
VTNQLVEFMNYYMTETIQEAKTYRDYANKTKIDVADMRLAISSKNYDSFVRPIPMQSVREVAEQKNK